MLFNALPESNFDNDSPALPPVVPAALAAPVPFPPVEVLDNEPIPWPEPEPEPAPPFVALPPISAFSMPMGLNSVQLLSQTPIARTSQPDKERQLIKVFITAPEEQADLLLQLPARWLDDPVCQRVFSACHELAATGRAVNLHSVVDQIRSQFTLPEQEALLAGYAELLREPILDTTDNLLIEVQKAYKCRVMYKDVLQNLNREFLRNTPIEDLYDKATRLLLGAEQEGSRRLPLIRVVENVYQRIMNPPAESLGYKTGLTLFDDIFGGVIPDRMIGFGGLTGSGKTAAAVDLTVRLLKRHADKLGILWISLEMSEEDLMNRVYSREATITTDRMRDHATEGNVPLSPTERAKLYDAHQVIKEWPKRNLDIHYGTVDAMMIRQLGRRWCLRCKADGLHPIIIIDHLGMVEHSGKSGDNIRAEFINSMKAIKSLNMDFGATTVPLVQLVKGVKSETRKDKFYRPHNGDVAESGFIEQTLDALILWWRPEAYATELGRRTMHYANNPDWDIMGRTIGIVGKNRYGQSGIDMVFDSRVQYSELSDGRADYL
ncbi:DnaB-like helicase C-terminal domain-containing protein [Hymenobacter siberiensis]|uniref:DnaB-like helicase C-terminal domain-containing protein n=1 Tax=Hymenobacter siberiensis TaxID=2848396 RepID=UPI001C1DF80E|nr:DnaB-like helicase C-terminal domain-containing protein [Hymenobacter siberiensis]